MEKAWKTMQTQISYLQKHSGFGRNEAEFLENWTGLIAFGIIYTSTLRITGYY